VSFVWVGKLRSHALCEGYSFHHIFSSPGFVVFIFWCVWFIRFVSKISCRSSCSSDKLLCLLNVEVLHATTEPSLDRGINASNELWLRRIPNVVWTALHDGSSNGKIARSDILLCAPAWADVNAFSVDLLVVLSSACAAVVVSLVVVHNSLWHILHLLVFLSSIVVVDRIVLCCFWHSRSGHSSLESVRW